MSTRRSGARLRRYCRNRLVHELLLVVHREPLEQGWSTLLSCRRPSTTVVSLFERAEVVALDGEPPHPLDAGGLVGGRIATRSSIVIREYQRVERPRPRVLAHPEPVRAHRVRAARGGRATAASPSDRPATMKLAASRFASHSNGPGRVSSKSLRSNTSERSGDRVDPEVGQVRVAAQLGTEPGRAASAPRSRGHDRGRAAVERERRDGHSPVADRQQFLHAGRRPAARGSRSGPAGPRRADAARARGARGAPVRGGRRRRWTPRSARGRPRAAGGARVVCRLRVGGRVTGHRRRSPRRRTSTTARGRSGRRRRPRRGCRACARRPPSG